MRNFLVAVTYLVLVSTAVTAKPTDAPKGKQLIAKSDCMGCHAEKAKIIGPSYADIALKYPANSKNITLLANRIIKGSKDIWGTIPMTAHAKLPKADAEEMVKYILSIKK
jgi:cytochrome c